MPIGHVTRATVEEYRRLRLQEDRYRGKPLTPATVNRDVAFLKTVFQRAFVWEFLDRNPLQGMEMLPERNKRDVDLKPEQIVALANELTETMGKIVLFAVYAGFREENILGLRIEDVQIFDLRSSTADPAGKVNLVVKGGAQESFPLGEAAVDILQSVIDDRAEGYVFVNARTGSRYRDVGKPFRVAVRRLGLTVRQDGKRVSLRFHDLRHVYATWLHARGISLDVIGNLMGHKTLKTTDRYTTYDRIAAGKALSLLPLPRHCHTEGQPRRSTVSEVQVVSSGR